MAMSSLIKPLKSVAVINLARHAIQLILGVLVARWLGVDDKGALFLFTTIAGTISVLFSFGYTNSLIYHCKKKIIGFQTSLIYLAVVSVSQLLLMSVITLFFDENISNFMFNHDQKELIFYLIVYTVVSLLSYFVNAYCLAFQYLTFYFINFSLSSLLVCLVSIVGFFLGDFELRELLLTLILVEALTTFYVIFRIKNIFVEINENQSYSISKYAFKSYLGISGSTLSSNGDSFILASFLSHEQIGIYSIAKTFYRLLAIIPQTTNSLLFGIFCGLERVQAKELIKKLFVLFFSLSLVVLVACYFILEYLIVFIYGEPFRSAYDPAIILIFSACLITVTSSINPYLLAFNRPLATSTITLVSSGVSLLCSIYLVQSYELLGAACAVLIGAICTFSMRSYFYLKEEVSVK